MNLPPKVILYGVTFTVEEALMAAENGRFATDEYPNIAVATSITGNLVAFTLLHEIGHAIAWQNSLGIDDERWADAFANGVLSLLKDNPALIAAIMKEDG